MHAWQSNLEIRERAMNLSRREWVLAGLAMLTGCASQETVTSPRPRIDWPSAGVAPPRPTAQVAVQPVVQAAPPPAPVAVTPTASPATGLQIIPRAQWAKASPIRSRLSAMGGISRITVHHEGMRPIAFTDMASTAARLETVRQSHLNRMKAGDIGYHFIIDRAGRVWEGRPIAYQGAHAGGANNQHNLGVMLLGNFDQQSPSDAQMAALVHTVRTLRRQYNVSMKQVFTHQELSPTRCPGVNLQPRMVALRHSGAFA